MLNLVEIKLPGFARRASLTADTRKAQALIVSNLLQAYTLLLRTPRPEVQVAVKLHLRLLLVETASLVALVKLCLPSCTETSA